MNRNRDLTIYQKDYLSQPYEPIQKMLRKDHLLGWLKKNKLENGKIMEVGCSDDSLANYMSDFELFQIIEPGVDFYKKAIHDIKEHKKHRKIKIALSTIEEFEKSEVEYDIIIVSCLLHEIQDQTLFLNALGHHMRKNTLLYIDVPNAFSFHRLLGKELGYIKDIFQKSDTQIKMQQNNVFSEQTLAKLLINNGFNIIEKGDYIFKPFTHAQMQLLIDRGIFTEEFLSGLARMSKYTKGMGSEIYITATYDLI